MHTTNYADTFIEIAEDCPAQVAQVPPVKADKRTVANIEHELIGGNPYRYTSDDVIFRTHAERNGMDPDDAASRAAFFGKGRACLRASPLTRRYGWGVHSDAEGRVALVPLGTDAYARLAADPTLTHVRAMRSKRA